MDFNFFELGLAQPLAKRMAPRKRKATASLSQASYDSSKFVSRDAWDHYTDNILGRNILPERNVKLYITEFDDFRREDKAPKQVRVRGHLIKFDADSLNTFLKTPVVLEQGESLPSYSRLVYGLVMKMDMNIGALISGQISLIAQSNSSRLEFPALITALCKALGVSSDSLTYKSLSPAINLSYIKKNCWNLDDPSVTFLGTRISKARGSEAPSSSAAPAPPTSTPSTSTLPLALAAPILPELAGCRPVMSVEEFLQKDDPATVEGTQQASPVGTPALDLNQEAMDQDPSPPHDQDH
ncbi:hypothetical protein HKD37_13G035548 [Glycine soja]